MNEILQEYIGWLAGAKAKKALLSQQMEELENKVKILQGKVDVYIKARWVISEATRLTQERVKGYIESLTTMAIRAVYDSDFEFLVDFKISRNKSECFFSIKEDGYEYVPKDDDGGGLIDIISFALRIVLYSLEKPRRRNVIILDEPFKWTGKLMSRAGEMIKEISNKLGLQIILITHEPELAEIADKSFLVERKDGISKVSPVEGSMVIGRINTPRQFKRLKRRKI